MKKFEIIKTYCKFLGLGRDDGGWADVCNKKSQVPKGHSWGECSEKVCPFLIELKKDEGKTD